MISLPKRSWRPQGCRPRFGRRGIGAQTKAHVGTDGALDGHTHVTVRLIKQTSWLDVLILTVSVGTLLYCCISWRGNWSDDAFISFRYARNLADGFGPVYNPGERVEGYSSPLWVFGLAVAIKLGIDPAWLARRVGIGSAIGLLILLYRSLVKAGVLGWGAALTTFLLSSCIIIHIWAMSGMETLFYSLILFGGLCRLALSDTTPGTSLWTSLALTLAVLTRPEAAVFWVGGLVLVVHRKRRDAVFSTLGYLSPSLLVVGYLGWRYFYFGDLLPNTYYAGVDTDPNQLLAAGAREMQNLLAMPGHVLWSLMALVGATRGGWRYGKGRNVLVMLGAVAIYVLYIASVDGESRDGFRFVVPMLAPLAFLAGLVFLGGPVVPTPGARRSAAVDPQAAS
jgi:arabinofuranosyltransferase